MNKKVIILGGGLAGIGAAYRLCQDGLPVELLEKETLIGGLGASVRKGDFIFDFGPHGYSSVDHALLEFFRQAMREDAIETFKNVKISFRNHLCQYPLQAMDLVRNISPCTSALAIMDYLFMTLKQKVNPRPDRNMQDWIVHRFGRTIYDLFFGLYTQKVWGVHPTKLDALFPQHRIPHTSLWRVILKSFRHGESVAENQEHKYCPLLVRSYYPARGSGVVPKNLCNMIEQRGAVVHRRACVELVELTEAGSAIVTYKKDGRRYRTEGKHVISTIPVTELLSMLQPTPPGQVMDAARKLRFRSVRIIGLGLRRDDVIPVQSIYYTDKSFNRLSDLVKNGGTAMAPSGKTVLTAEITCDKGDQVWTMYEADLINEVINELRADAILQQEDVEQTISLKVEHAYPIYLLGFANSIKTVSDYFSKISNLYTTGRQGTFQYFDMDIAFDMGRIVANNIASNAPKQEWESPLEVPYF